MHDMNQGSKGSGGEEVLFPAVDAEGDGEEVPEEVGPRQSEEQEEEAREVQSPTTPVTPSLEEVRQHRLTHTPF